MGDVIVHWNESGGESAVTERLLSYDFLAVIKSELAGRWVQLSQDGIRLSRTATELIFRVILPTAVITVCSWSSFQFNWQEIGTRVTLWIIPVVGYLMQANFSIAFLISTLDPISLDAWAITSLLATGISVAECVRISCKEDPDCNSR